MQYPQYEDELIVTLENDAFLPFGAEVGASTLF